MNHEFNASFEDYEDEQPETNLNLDNFEDYSEEDDEQNLLINKEEEVNLDSFEEQEDAATKTNEEPANDVIADLLAAKGIEDPTKIQYENDNGEIEEYSFYDLDYEEQLALLNSNDSDINFGLNDDEVYTVNILRENGITLEQLIDYYQGLAVSEYINSKSSEEYEVDNFSDEELFILDLKSKYSDLSSEEITQIIEHERNNEALFNRKLEFLRNSYKEAEDLQRSRTLKEEEESKTIKFEESKNALITSSKDIQDIGGIDIEETEKNDTLSWILDTDVTGKTEFEKALDNPDLKFKMAWFIKHGDAAFDILHNYYKGEIDKVRKSSYEKAKEDLSKKTATTANRQQKRQEPKSDPKPNPVNKNPFAQDYVDQDSLFQRSFRK